MSDSKDIIRKVYHKMKHYKDSDEKICIQLLNNPGIELIGKVKKLKRWAMFSDPYMLLDNNKFFLYEINPERIFTADTETREIKEKRELPGRKGISKSLKFAVWDRYFGEQLRGKCLCCGVQEITRDDCEMCHIISVAEGGETNVNNLKPGCKDCNRSMGTMNFDDYKAQYH